MYKLKLDIYECTVILHIVDTNKDVSILANKIMKKNKIDGKIEDLAWGYMISTFNKYNIILSQPSLKDFNTFLHELTHCIDAVLEDRNIEDDEARAYLQGYVGNYFLKIILNYISSSKIK
jgi:hypothetical protein